MFPDPPVPDAPGVRIAFKTDVSPSAVTFSDDTLRLPILQDGPNVMYDDRGYPDRQRDYDFLS